MDSKNYILSIQATLKGDKVVLSGLQQIEGETKKFAKTVSMTGEKTQDFNDILSKAGARALIVAPIWLAIRTAMMGVLAVMSKIVSDNMKFEDSMADVRTMLEGTGAEIEAQFTTAKKTILDTAVNSRSSLSDLTDAFRFLKSANLDFQQTMAGFPIVASLMSTFQLSAMEASRAVAGMANTADVALGANLTMADKFSKIGDILAYTYVKQDVMIGELIQSYAKFAPSLTMTSNSFLEIVTTLGLLNTLMNRGSRAGTEMGRGLLNIITKSDKLAQVFNITYDRTKPLNYLEILTKIQERIGTTGKLSSEQAKNISTVFGNIGLKAFGLLLPNLDKLKDAIGDAEKNAQGYLKRLEEIRMSTTEAQLGRMSNILSVLGNDFISGVYGVGDYAEALKLLNDTLTELRPNFEGLGIGIGWLGETLGRSMAHWEALLKGNWGELIGKSFVPPVRSLNDYIDALIQSKGEAEKTAETRKALVDLQKKEKETQQEQVANLKEQSELLKLIGVNEYAIALYKYQQASASNDEKNAEKALFEVVQARARLNDEMHKKQLSFITQFLTGTAQQKTEMMKVVELMKRTPEELAYLIGTGGMSEKLLLANEKYLTKAQKTAIDLAKIEYGKQMGIEFAPETAESLLPDKTQMDELASIYSTSMKDANSGIVDDFARKMLQIRDLWTINKTELTTNAPAIETPEESRWRTIAEGMSSRYSEEIKLSVDVNLSGKVSAESDDINALKIVDATEKLLTERLGKSDTFQRMILSQAGTKGKVSSGAGGGY